MPGAGGAYLLLIKIGADMPFHLKKQPCVLAPGWYVYAGSAHGPGGMRARVARHMKPDKTPHWHIDNITIAWPPVAAICYPGGHECDLVRDLIRQQTFAAPLPGFGSSDCRTCTSHLLVWQAH